jgi:hypothetical protein
LAAVWCSSEHLAGDRLVGRRIFTEDGDHAGRREEVAKGGSGSAPGAG